MPAVIDTLADTSEAKEPTSPTNSTMLASDKSTSTPSDIGKQPWNTTKPESLYVMKMLGHRNIQNTLL